MYNYCSQCGQQATKGARYCIKCGALLSDGADSADCQNPNTDEASFKSSTDSFRQTLKESFSSDMIDKISASCKVYCIKVTCSDTEDIQVTWDQTESWSLTPQEMGRTLHLKENYRLGLHNIHDFLHNPCKNMLWIDLPKKKAFDLVLENDTGSIYVSEIEVNRLAELKSTIGHIDVNNLKTGENLFISTGTGSIHVSSVEAGQTVRLNTQVGKIKADGVKAASFFTDTTSGRCSCSEISADNQFTITGGVGEFILDTISSHKIDVRMNSGNINCRDLYAESAISVYNSVGSITCGIRDDSCNYTTHCHSDQGQSNQPEVSGEGDKKLNVRTSLGSVNIYFSERPQP